MNDAGQDKVKEEIRQGTGEARVSYRHFDTSNDVFTGTVLASKHGKLGISLLIEPDANQVARFTRWRSVRDVVEFLPAKAKTEKAA